MAGFSTSQAKKKEQPFETFNKIEQEVNLLITATARQFGIKNAFVRNVLAYGKCLVKPGTKDTIDEIIFTYQMMKYFGIVDRMMLVRMYTVLRDPKMPVMSVSDYVRGICTLLSQNVDILTQYTFRIYDLSQRGLITSLELTQLLKPCVVAAESDDADPDEMVSDMVDLVMAATDFDRSGGICFKEYSTKVKSDILLLQFLGKCLPSDKARTSFHNRLTGCTVTDITAFFRVERRKCLTEGIPPLSGYYPFHLALP